MYIYIINRAVAGGGGRTWSASQTSTDTTSTDDRSSSTSSFNAAAFKVRLLYVLQLMICFKLVMISFKQVVVDAVQ
jgi:hypothetical protein